MTRTLRVVALLEAIKGDLNEWRLSVAEMVALPSLSAVSAIFSKISALSFFLFFWANIDTLVQKFRSEMLDSQKSQDNLEKVEQCWSTHMCLKT